MTTRTQRFLLLLVAALCFGGAASAHTPDDDAAYGRYDRYGRYEGYGRDRRLESPWSRMERRGDRFAHGDRGCDPHSGCRVRWHWERWERWHRHHHRHGWGRGCDD